MELPAINSQTMWACEGALVRGLPRFSTYSQPGADGRGVLFGSRDEQPQTLITTLAVSGEALAVSTWAEFQDLVGSAVPVVDGLGQSWDDVIVLAVQPALQVGGSALPWAPAGCCGTDGDHVIVCAWSLLLPDEATT